MVMVRVPFSVGGYRVFSKIMQTSCRPGMNADSVDLLAAAGSVTEADDVRAVLPEPGGESQSLGVVDEREVARLAVGIIAHQDGQLAPAS